MNFQRILTHKVAPTRDPLTELASQSLVPPLYRCGK